MKRELNIAIFSVQSGISLRITILLKFHIIATAMKALDENITQAIYGMQDLIIETTDGNQIRINENVFDNYAEFRHLLLDRIK
jgi:hypothetical protein